MPPQPVMKIVRTKSGTRTLYIHRPNRSPVRWRTGIPDYAEALKRARIVAHECGYRVDPKEYPS